MKRHARGLTLLELITTVAIAAIALSIGIPAFGATLERVRAAGVYNTTTTAMALARNLAVIRHQPTAVCPSSDGLRCRTDGIWDAGWIIFVDPGRTGQPAEAVSVIRRFDALATRLHLHATAGRQLVRYQPNGSAAGTNLTLSLCSDTRLLGAVIVNNPGRARTTREKYPPACPFAAH